MKDTTNNIMELTAVITALEYVLEILKKGPKSAGEIAQVFDLTGATVSYHLSQLKKAGLIYEERQKNYIYYHLDATVFEEILVWIAALGGKNNEKETEK